jgi:ATP-dependent Clp protease ATP-binding subunit ClpA
MYDRFTDRACEALSLADQEARRLYHEYLGTEHILLGLIREGGGAAANVLRDHLISWRAVRLEVQQIVQPSLTSPHSPHGNKLPRSPRARKVIEYATEEARTLNQDYVGTEHLLLGLLREEEGIAAQVLKMLGLDLERVREELLNLLSPPLPGALSSVEADRRPSLELPDLPATVKRERAEFDAQIERLNEGKEEAVAEQDFEKAAHLRDQADKLKKKKENLLREWPARYPIDPSWLSWNGGAVATIARLIAEERRWEELPVLGDALQEAGCTDREILDHCRQPGEHLHRCWVLRLLLGKV